MALMVEVLIQPLAFCPAMVAVAVGRGWFETGMYVEFPLAPVGGKSAAPRNWVRVSSGHRSSARRPDRLQFVACEDEYMVVAGGV